MMQTIVKVAIDLRDDRREGAVIRVMFVATLLFVAAAPAVPANAVDVKVGYLGHPDKTMTISLIETPTTTDGLAGEPMTIDDNNTTGKFLNQSFALQEILLNGDDDPPAAVQKFSNREISLIVTDISADNLLKAA